MPDYQLVTVTVALPGALQTPNPRSTCRSEAEVVAQPS